jgi:hypothetical protein
LPELDRKISFNETAEVIRVAKDDKDPIIEEEEEDSSTDSDSDDGGRTAM